LFSHLKLHSALLYHGQLYFLFVLFLHKLVEWLRLLKFLKKSFEFLILLIPLLLLSFHDLYSVLYLFVVLLPFFILNLFFYLFFDWLLLNLFLPLFLLYSIDSFFELFIIFIYSLNFLSCLLCFWVVWRVVIWSLHSYLLYLLQYYHLSCQICMRIVYFF
jgi:hypothetical protein